MEFSGQYLIYQEYMALGGTLDLTPFNLLEFEARKKIDGRTQARLKNINSENIPQEVKLCVFKIINSVTGYAKTSENIAKNGNVASENTDGYSVSYITPAQIKDVIESKNVEINDIIDDCLFGVIVNGEHIIYCGAKTC